MSRDTKWIIGTMVGFFLASTALVSVQLACVATRIDDMSNRIERVMLPAPAENP